MCQNHKLLWMLSCVTSKNVKWCHLIWPTLYTIGRNTLLCCSHFGRQFGRRQYVAVVMTLYADTIDLSVVNSCDWHTMQFLSEIINIREYSDYVFTLQFSDGFYHNIIKAKSKRRLWVLPCHARPSGIPGNSREFGIPKIPAGIPGNFENSILFNWFVKVAVMKTHFPSFFEFKI